MLGLSNEPPILHRGGAPALRKSIRLPGELSVGGVTVGRVKPMGEAFGIGDRLMGHDEFFNACCDYLPQFLGVV